MIKKIGMGSSWTGLIFIKPVTTGDPISYFLSYHHYWRLWVLPGEKANSPVKEILTFYVDEDIRKLCNIYS